MEKKLTTADLKVGMVFETVHGGEPRTLTRNYDGSYSVICPHTGAVGVGFRTLEDLLPHFNDFRVYLLRPESKRVFVAGMKFMCEKPSDRQLVQFDKEENFTIINTNNGARMWRDITPAQLSRLFDDGFYRFNPTDKAERPVTKVPELAAGYSAQQYWPTPTPYGLIPGKVAVQSAADTVELHFANGTTVTVSVK